MSSEPSRGGLRIRWWPLVIGLVAAGFIMVRGCQEGPFGRRQVVGLNPDQEARLGAQAFQQVLQESRVVGSGPAVDAVRRVGARLAAAAEGEAFLHAVELDRQKFAWDFRVVESPQVNAFCLPGGKVVVYTGIIPVCRTEAGLATVMGHEIAHALAHHGAERMAHQQLVQIGQMAAAGSIEGVEPEQRRQIMAVLGAGGMFGILLPYSRKHESEADHMGLLLMAAAGYDPHEAPRFWERMQKKGGGGPSEFMSTHPSHEHRIRDLNNWIEEALPLYKQGRHEDSGRDLHGEHPTESKPARRLQPERVPR